MAAPLIYFNTASLDGYIADSEGSWDWGVPDEEVHSFVNKLITPARTHLYGRKNYEVMSFWEDIDFDALPAAEREFAEAWNSIEKVVYSTTLTEVRTRNTLLRSSFEPAEVRRMKERSDHPLAIGGGELASAAGRAGLLDEVHVMIAPATTGGGTRFLGSDARLELQLRDERRFANGFVYLGYDVV